METAKDRALYGFCRNEKYRKNAAVGRAVRDVGQCRSIMNNRLFNAVKSRVQNRRVISVSKKRPFSWKIRKNGLFRLLLGDVETFVEALNASAGVDQLLSSGKERMAV